MAGYIGSKAVSVNTTSATITGDASIGGDLSLGDNDKIILGAGSDLQIYHDGNSKITDVGDGKLELHSNGTGVFIQKGATEYMAQFLTDGAVTLYHDNAAKLATKATGVTVTGEMAATTMDLSSNAVIDGSVSIGVAGSTTYALQSKVKAVYFSSTDSSYANITIRKEAATSTDYLQVRDNGNNLISKMTSGGELTVGNGLILTDGNLTVATAHGIAFGNASGNTKTIVSNLLDDYEEGTHQTAITMSTSGTATLDTSFDRFSYTKIGRLVTITGNPRIASVSSPVGNMSLTIPFTALTGQTDELRAGGIMRYYDNSAGSGSYSKPLAWAIQEGASAVVIDNTGTNGNNLAPAASDEFYFSISYMTA